MHFNKLHSRRCYICIYGYAVKAHPEPLAGGLSVGLPLAASQVHQVDLAGDRVLVLLTLKRLSLQGKI